MRKTLLAGILLLLSLTVSATASLSPSEVVVVYNSSDVWNDDHVPPRNVSKLVADYYCLVRDIPAENEVGINWPWTKESANPVEFVDYLLNDRPGFPGLKSFLASRPGFDINDPGSDPTKCIVLCYGVPVKLTGGEAGACVDSALTLLFNTTPWGRQPVSNYLHETSAVRNPFWLYDTGGVWSPVPVNPFATRRYDFGDFRASTRTGVNETALETSPSACLGRAFGRASCRQGGIGGPPQAD